MHIDESNASSTSTNQKQQENVDFFHETTSQFAAAASLAPVQIQEPTIVDKSHEGPSVSAAFSEQQPEESSAIKSNILQKKPVQPKKVNLFILKWYLNWFENNEIIFQKGLGAQKVNTDFKEIERQMLEQERNRELEIQQQAKNKEEQEKQMEKQMASMKLAYNNLDKQREKEEAKLMKVDPNKANQLERLGMAVGTRTTGISHSALNDMQIIQQEGVSRGNGNNSSQPSYGKSNRDFFDEMEFGSKPTSGFYGRDNEEDNFKGFGSCKLTLFLE